MRRERPFPPGDGIVSDPDKTEQLESCGLRSGVPDALGIPDGEARIVREPDDQEVSATQREAQGKRGSRSHS